MPQTTFTYDDVPYPSYTFPQTHPDRLATMATLNGMFPADPENCRVLEIGCGDGSNLLSFAYALPDSRFVGIDLSEVHIVRANETKAFLGISNIELRQGDVSELGSEKLGKFDFIIAHGLFSWVPEAVRPHILRIYSECLAPNGVGYISYNAYPGCHIREITSGIMRFAGTGTDGAEAKVSAGLSFLEAVAKATEEDTVYKTLLSQEIGQIETRSVQNVFHDDLSTFNRAFYFDEFVEMITPFGLQFLSEADPISSNPAKFPAAARKLIAAAGENIVRREQTIDLISGRRFRSTLICRNELALERNPGPDVLPRFYLSSRTRADGKADVIGNEQAVRFVGSKGASLEINHPLTKAALVLLAAGWPRRYSLDNLIGEAGASIGLQVISDDDKEKTTGFLLQLFNAGFVKLNRYAPSTPETAGEFPASSRFAQWQIEQGSENITTLLGKNLKADDPVLRQLISLLDGKRDRGDLAREIGGMFEVLENKRQAFETELPAIIEQNLLKLAEAGLLKSEPPA